MGFCGSVGARRGRPGTQGVASGPHVAGRGSTASTTAWWRRRGTQEHYGAPVGRSRCGRGCVRECVCTQRPETALAYTLPVWSAMAEQQGLAASRGRTGAHRWCWSRMDSGAVAGCGRVAPDAVQCRAALWRRPCSGGFGGAPSADPSSFSRSLPSSSLGSLSWLRCAEGSHKVAAGR